jgi:hypothetical protein
VSDIDTAAVDSLKVLDPNRPIREATRILQRRDWSLCASSITRALLESAEAE